MPGMNDIKSKTIETVDIKVRETNRNDILFKRNNQLPKTKLIQEDIRKQDIKTNNAHVKTKMDTTVKTKENTAAKSRSYKLKDTRRNSVYIKTPEDIKREKQITEYIKKKQDKNRINENIEIWNDAEKILLINQEQESKTDIINPINRNANISNIASPPNS